MDCWEGKTMGGITDFLFGGSDDSGQTAQIKANKDALKLQADLANMARGDVTKLFPLSDVNRNVGYQSALDMIAAGTPNQIAAFQQGNTGAQNALISGQQQFQNAIMGNPVGMGQAQQFNVDTSYLNQQLPSFVGVGSIADLQNLLENPSSLADYLGGFGGAQAQNPPASAAQYQGPDYGGGNSPDTGGSQGGNQGAGVADPVGAMSTAGLQAELDALNDPINDIMGLLTPLGIQTMYSRSRKAAIKSELSKRSQPHHSVTSTNTGIDQSVDPSNPEGVAGSGGTGSGTGAGVGHGGEGFGGYGGGDMGGV